MKTLPLFALLAALGCTGEVVMDADAAPARDDASVFDAGRDDAGREDASAPTDASTPDSGPPPIADDLRAFPGAMGFGKDTTGGRGGRVVQVTNLNDSGDGSLRAALEMTGPRTVVFRVSGIIDADSPLTIGNDHGDLTIAGQTAPGDGVAIRGAELRVLASNVIVRYLRVRPGPGTTGSNEDGIRIIAYSGRLVEDVIVDHCSVSWAKDEVFAVGGIGDGSRVQDVTVQHSILGENIDTQYGLLLWNRATNITVYGNYFVHNKERNIRSSTCTSTFEMVNNVVYSYRAATRPTYENVFDVIGNVFLTNPAVEDRLQTIRLEASTNNCPDGMIERTRAHLADNLLDDGVATVSSNLDPYLEDAPTQDSGLTARPASEVREWVWADVGASFPVRDAADARVIEHGRTRTGDLLTDPADAGGYPALASGEPYPDDDLDGMDDDWERRVGLDPSDGEDGATDRDGDGYTNLEEFLHRLVDGSL